MSKASYIHIYPTSTFAFEQQFLFSLSVRCTYCATVLGQRVLADLAFLLRLVNKEQPRLERSWSTAS